MIEEPRGAGRPVPITPSGPLPLEQCNYERTMADVDLLAGTTPGPWNVGSDIEANARFFCANRQITFGPFDTAEEVLANARLIAAAPDLARENVELRAEREALRTALERIADPRNHHFAGDAQVVARTALAQASEPSNARG